MKRQAPLSLKQAVKPFWLDPTKITQTNGVSNPCRDAEFILDLEATLCTTRLQ